MSTPLDRAAKAIHDNVCGCGWGREHPWGGTVAGFDAHAALDAALDVDELAQVIVDSLSGYPRDWGRMGPAERGLYRGAAAAVRDHLLGGDGQ